MKKLGVLSAVALFAALSFVSCNKSSDGGGGGSNSNPSTIPNGQISGTIVNIPAGTPTTVTLVVIAGTTGNTYTTATAQVNGTNATFSATLPTPPANELMSISVISDNVPQVTISNPSAKIAIAYIEAGDPLNAEVVNVSNDNPISKQVVMLYVDSDVTVKGGATVAGVGGIIDLNLKKGWNWVLDASTTTSESITTGNIPSGMVWKLDLDLTFINSQF